MIVARASRVRWPPDSVPTRRPGSRLVQAEPGGRQLGAPVGVPRVVGQRPLQDPVVRRGRLRRSGSGRRAPPASRSTSATARRSGASVRASTSATEASSGKGGSWPSITRSSGRSTVPATVARGGQPAGDGAQQGGLADAVLPDQADAAAGLGEQVDAGQDGAGAVRRRRGHGRRGAGDADMGGPSRECGDSPGTSGEVSRGRESGQAGIHMMARALSGRRLVLSRPYRRCVHELTREQARRIAVRAQLLDADRPTDLLEAVRHLTLLQVEPTAAVAPSAHVVAWSRLGASYRTSRRSTTSWPTASLVELHSMLRPAEDLALYRAEMAAWPGPGRAHRVAGRPRGLGRGQRRHAPRHPRPAARRGAAARRARCRTRPWSRGGRAGGTTTATSDGCST